KVETRKTSQVATIQVHKWIQVTFDLNGQETATSVLQIQKRKADETVEEPVAPIVEKYVFGGWYTDKECTDANVWVFDGENADKVTEDITLYAKWTLKEYSITHKLKNVTVSETLEKIPYGTSYEIKLKAKENYELPINVTVSVGGKNLLEGEGYIYNSRTGELKLEGYQVTGDIVIKAEGIFCMTPIVITDPQDKEYFVGDRSDVLTIAVPDSNGENLSYQWYISTDGSIENGKAIVDATKETYTPDTSKVGTFYYYCIVTNTIKDAEDATKEEKVSVTTDVAKIVVHERTTETAGTTETTAATTTATTGTANTTETTATADTTGTTVTKSKAEKNAIAMNAGLKVDQKGKWINIKWGRVKEADGYLLYAQYCGKNFSSKKPAKIIKGSSVTSVKITKINGKKLNLKKNYKLYVASYKLVGNKKVILGKTIVAHIVGYKNTKQTNVKGIRLTRSNFTLKKGRSAVIKAKTVLVDKTKKQLSDKHAAEFRYASNNKKVAVASKNGRITAKRKGSCIIYVYARNGYAKKVKVTVK
ncbi:MAG: InlB B-repeat-containing protein, partial [Lachnospiraceae bacterium]|nr:InlB B-repeat-containing protein [Lachnospiraceae bacterium]